MVARVAGIVSHGGGSDSLPEDERPSETAVRLECVVGNLARERESQPCVEGGSATVDGCIEYQKRTPALDGK